MPEAGRLKRPAYYLHQWFWGSVDWLFPATCAGCEKPGLRWCEDCQRQVELLGANVCRRCGRPQQDHTVCQTCKAEPPLYQSLASWAVYGGPLRQAIHKLKYNHDLGLGDTFSQYLVECLAQQAWAVDLVLPVPASPKRLKERGYNQADLLAKPLARAFGLHYEPKGLSKIKETTSQVGLTRPQRQMNVTGAFISEGSIVHGARVLVVDDVTTTGATMEACAQALLEAGAERVWGLTLARAGSQTAEGFSVA